MKKIIEFIKTFHISISIIIAALIIGYCLMQASSRLASVLFMK